MWRGVKCKKTGKVGMDQIMKSFLKPNRTLHFILEVIRGQLIGAEYVPWLCLCTRKTALAAKCSKD